MSAIKAALDAINDVGQDGDLTSETPGGSQLVLDDPGDPLELPDGRQIYPPRLHGEPIDELACRLLNGGDPAQSKFLRLTGPPGTGKSQIARTIAYRLWRGRGRAVEIRHGTVSRFTASWR